MTNPQFYSKVADRFGAYSTGTRRTTDYPQGNPEDFFNAAMEELGGQERTLLDVGCADGRNLLRVASHYAAVTGIDLSAEMLASARTRQREAEVEHVTFDLRDAGATGYPDESFDVLTSRRGPLAQAEFARLLRPGGTLLYMGIGEQDARELKESFGRGQLFGRWTGEPLMREASAQLREAGLHVEEERTFAYEQFFYCPEDLQRFLQVVPIFEDFDPEADRYRFSHYLDRATSGRGVRLSRHWFVVRAGKPSRAA
ncbi:class I SAM-dependent methyltransferase [Actinoplanes sp. NPDC049118]|uniref:class I SAM-dependent methyltransferase n=1 Tax=Actinoplanes sp. NPDC049118 TaxID=3155769 RepID=UPI003406FA12